MSLDRNARPRPKAEPPRQFGLVAALLLMRMVSGLPISPASIRLLARDDRRVKNKVLKHFENDPGLLRSSDHLIGFIHRKRHRLLQGNMLARRGSVQGGLVVQVVRQQNLHQVQVF